MRSKRALPCVRLRQTARVGDPSTPLSATAMAGSDQEPTGLIDSASYLAADTYATGDATWIPDYPHSHLSQMVDYDCLEGWLATHLPAPWMRSLSSLTLGPSTR